MHIFQNSLFSDGPSPLFQRELLAGACMFRTKQIFKSLKKVLRNNFLSFHNLNSPKGLITYY